MNSWRSLAALILCLSAMGSFASEPPAPTLPARPANQRNLFVGAYGEIVELPYGWTADAEMREAVEAVYFHRKSIDKFGLKPFNPKPSDYKPENFGALRLVELLVIPKNAPNGFRNLSEMRSAKEKELAGNGSVYRFVEPSERSGWPRGTFEVRFTQPRLVQTYAESQREFYILTMGWAPAEAAYAANEDEALDYRYALDEIYESLARHLSTVQMMSGSGKLFSSEGAVVRSSGAPNVLRIGLVVFVPFLIMVIFAFWPKRTGGAAKIRLYGRALVLFSLTSALTGFLCIYLPARLSHAVWRHLEDAIMVASMPSLMIAWLAVRRFSSKHPYRVLLAVGILFVIWMAIWFNEPRQSDLVASRDAMLEVPLFLFGFGILIASAFTAAFGSIARVVSGK